MTHFVGLVVANDEMEVANLLAPFDENKDVPEYFAPSSKDDVEHMAKHYELDESDLENLCGQIEDWTNHKGAIQDGVLGKLTTYNPNSKWDWYVVGGRWSDVIPGLHRCLAEEVAKHFPEYTPAILVDAKGWHATQQYGWWGFSESTTEDPEIITKKLLEHAGKNVFVVDFHGA